jgi:hypothetical protein
MLSDLEYSLFGYFYAFRFLGLQEQVKKPGGKIKLRCTWLEALRWQEFKDSPNTRGL